MTTTMKPITQPEYLHAELDYLFRHLAIGDLENAATSAATLRGILHRLSLPDACARIATENGRYYHWPVLDE